MVRLTVPTARFARPVCWVVPVTHASGREDVVVQARSNVKAQRAARRLHRKAVAVGEPRRSP